MISDKGCYVKVAHEPDYVVIELGNDHGDAFRAVMNFEELLQLNSEINEIIEKAKEGKNV